GSRTRLPVAGRRSGLPAVLVRGRLHRNLEDPRPAGRRLARLPPLARRTFGQLPLVMLALVWSFSAACKHEGGKKMWVPTVAANGATDTCPRDRMTSSSPDYASPDDIRCSYRRDPGAQNSRLYGTVFGEQSGAYPGVPLEGVTVTLHEVKQGAPAKERARASSDPQGHFRFAAILEPAEYIMTARNEAGDILARRFVTVPGG